MAKSLSAHPTVTVVPERLTVGILPAGMLNDFAAPGPLPWLDQAAQPTNPPAEKTAIAAATISDRGRRQLRDLLSDYVRDNDLLTVGRDGGRS